MTSPQRQASLPQVPTMAELGLPGLQFNFWAGLFAPAGTPAPVLAQLEAEVNRIVRMPDIAERMTATQVTPSGGSAAELGRTLAADLARWGEVAKKAGIKPRE